MAYDQVPPWPRTSVGAVVELERVTTIGFGGPGEPGYFTPNGQPISARIQSSTDAVFPTPSSFTAWDYPPEPILQY